MTRNRDRYGENRKPIHELKRPRRRLGDKLRELASCPLCFRQVRVVAWRGQSARLECRRCGLRFSIKLDDLSGAMRRLLDRAQTDPDVVVVDPGPLAITGHEITSFDADFIDDARHVYPGSGQKWTPAASRRWPSLS